MLEFLINNFIKFDEEIGQCIEFYIAVIQVYYAALFVKLSPFSLEKLQELNTAEDFISFYEEMLPLVQTLPQIVLQKELILLELLSRLNMKGRLSLEPILRYLCIVENLLGAL